MYVCACTYAWCIAWLLCWLERDCCALQLRTHLDTSAAVLLPRGLQGCLHVLDSSGMLASKTVQCIINVVGENCAEITSSSYGSGLQHHADKSSGRLNSLCTQCVLPIRVTPLQRCCSYGWQVAVLVI
jgi:hypothetical protein